MESGYIDGTVIPEFDLKITDFLNKKSIQGDQGNMVTAIQNEKKNVYRIIHTDGLDQYINLVTFLADLGLDDRLAESMESKNGYDSFFTIPKN